MQDMDSTESLVPPGFRFHPTDEELVGYYLKKKVASQKIDLDVIRDVDLYRIEPWDLTDKCRIGYEEQSEWYFFSHKDKKYPTGTRTNRATMAGFWKATGRDKAVHDKNKLIGMRKTLVFYKGRAPNGQKTDWIMHEYRLESEENAPPQEEGWVVCRAFRKRTTTQQRPPAVDTWDSPYCYIDVDSGSHRAMTSLIDPLHFLHSQHSNNINNFCKQEAEFEHLNLLHSNTFVQLPQLESPSLPLIKPLSSSLSVASENEEDQEQARVTDWRALDKFVASQLSQDQDGFVPEHELMISEFNVEGGSEMAGMLMLQGHGGEEGISKLDGLLSSDAICVLEK